MGLFSSLACWWELMFLRSSSFRRKKAYVSCLSWCSEAGTFCALLAWWDRSRAAKTFACICLLPTCASTLGFSSSSLDYRDHGLSSSWDCSVWSGLYPSDGRTRARSTLLRLFYGSSRLRDGLRSLGLFSGCVLFGPVRFWCRFRHLLSRCVYCKLQSCPWIC